MSYRKINPLNIDSDMYVHKLIPLEKEIDRLTKESEDWKKRGLEWATKHGNLIVAFNKQYDELKLLEKRIQVLTEALEIYAATNETFPEYGDVARKTLAISLKDIPK